MLKDLLFSYLFVFVSVIVGGYAAKLLYFGSYVNSIFLVIAAIYLFGIGCMGIKRLEQYKQGECINAKTS